MSLNTKSMNLAVVVGGVSNAVNLGAGDGVFAQLNGSNLEFKSLVAGANITLTPSATEIEIAGPAGAGEANTSSNVGTGEGLALTKVGVDLPFKSLLGETNRIILTGNVNDVTFTLGSEVVLNNQTNTYSGAGDQDFAGSALRNVAFVESNTTSPASAGFIRGGNAADAVAWRNFANTNNVDIIVNAVDAFLLRINGTTEYIISATEFDFTSNNAINLGTLNTHTIPSGTSTFTLQSDNLGVFATTTSLQLAGVISDETGTGLLVFGTSPTIITPTIASFTNATHDHSNAAGGGQLTNSAIAAGAEIDVAKLADGNPGQFIRTDAAGTGVEYTDDIFTINFIIDGGGSAITTGIKGQVVVDFNCEVIEWAIIGLPAGAIVVDVSRSTFAGFPTTVSIAGTELPTIIATNDTGEDRTLTSWSTINTGDILEFEVDSVATIERCTVALKCRKTG